MHKLLLLLVPCALTVVLVRGYYGGGYGGGNGFVLTQGYPFNTYSNAVSLMYSKNDYGDDYAALANYRNPFRWAFLLPLALALAIGLNYTALKTNG